MTIITVCPCHFALGAISRPAVDLPFAPTFVCAPTWGRADAALTRSLSLKHLLASPSPFAFRQHS
eukprot:3557864-Pleurochrysis_carterae.AAC.1